MIGTYLCFNEYSNAGCGQWIVAEKLDNNVYAIAQMGGGLTQGTWPGEIVSKGGQNASFQNISEFNSALKELYSTIQYAEAQGGRNNETGKWSVSETKDGLYLIPSSMYFGGDLNPLKAYVANRYGRMVKSGNYTWTGTKGITVRYKSTSLSSESNATTNANIPVVFNLDIREVNISAPQLYNIGYVSIITPKS